MATRTRASLTEADFINHNPTLRFVLHARAPMLSITTWLVGWYLFLLAATAADGALVIPGEHAGYFEDLAHYGLLLTLWWAVAALLRLFKNSVQLVGALESNSQGHMASDSHASELHAELKAAINTVTLRSPRGRRLYWGLMAFMAALIYLFSIHVPVFHPQPVRSWALWPQQYPIASAAAVVWNVFGFGIVVGNVLWYTMTSAAVLFPLVHRLISRGLFQVIPVAPDGKAGLSALGAISFSQTLILGAGLPFMLTWLVVFGADTPMVAGFAFYLIALVAGFFLPLMWVHKDMERAKELELARIAFAFRDEYRTLPAIADLQEGLDQTRRLGLHSSTAHLSRLDQLYRRAEAMPVWPFDPSTLGQFFSLIIAPLIVFMIQFFTEDALTSLLRIGR